MQLVEELNEGINLIRRVADDGVLVGGRLFSSSFVITPERVVSDFPVRSLDDFGDDAIDAVLALEPALILIGTGPRQHLAPPSLMGVFLSRGIGLEAMDSHAAARTYNLLAGEGRRVASLFLL